MNTVSWLAQQENLISIRPREASRPPADADRAPDHADVLAVDRRHPGRGARDGRLHLVEAAGLMGRLISTLAMVLVLAGLAGYIYFADGDSAGDTTTTKEKAFGTVAADDIEEVRIAAERGDAGAADQEQRHLEAGRAVGRRRRRRRAVVDHRQPVHARHRAGGGREARRPGAVRPRAGPHRRRRSRSRARPREKRILLGDKTATGGDIYAKLPDSPRVFLVSSFVESTFKKDPFSLRDKTILKVDRAKVDGFTASDRHDHARVREERLGLDDREADRGPRRFRRRRGRHRAAGDGEHAGHHRR